MLNAQMFHDTMIRLRETGWSTQATIKEISAELKAAGFPSTKGITKFVKEVYAHEQRDFEDDDFDASFPVFPFQLIFDKIQYDTDNEE